MVGLLFIEEDSNFGIQFVFVSWVFRHRCIDFERRPFYEFSLCVPEPIIFMLILVFWIFKFMDSVTTHVNNFYAVINNFCFTLLPRESPDERNEVNEKTNYSKKNEDYRDGH